MSFSLSWAFCESFERYSASELKRGRRFRSIFAPWLQIVDLAKQLSRPAIQTNSLWKR